MDPSPTSSHLEKARSLQAGSPNQPALAMPRLELPAGVADTPVTDRDRSFAELAKPYGYTAILQKARQTLRQARRVQRRANRRPHGTLRAQRRTVKESLQSRQLLIDAGIFCGICELLRAELTPGPEQIARVRERCEQRHAEEVPRYAVDLENWIHDLAGEDRLTRG